MSYSTLRNQSDDTIDTEFPTLFAFTSEGCKSVVTLLDAMMQDMKDAAVDWRSPINQLSYARMLALAGVIVMQRFNKEWGLAGEHIRHCVNCDTCIVQEWLFYLQDELNPIGWIIDYTNNRGFGFDMQEFERGILDEYANAAIAAVKH